MKKGIGLSIQTIIIAAIVLIVLIVLWAIFVGNMTKTTGSIKENTEKYIKKCTDDLVDGKPQDGSSKQDSRNNCEAIGGFIIPGEYSDVTGNKVCCKTP